MVLHNSIKFDRNPSEVMAVTQSEWMDMNEWGKCYRLSLGYKYGLRQTMRYIHKAY